MQSSTRLFTLFLCTHVVISQQARSAAVIVESRWSQSFEYVIDNALIHLPNTFDVVLLVNPHVATQFLQQNRHAHNPRIYVNTAHVATTFSRQDYNVLIKQRFLYESVLSRYDTILFFQTDTCFCRPFEDVYGRPEEYNDDDNDAAAASAAGVGYVGAVWDTSVSPKGFACATLRDPTLPRAHVQVGNGGFSLRSRQLSLDILDRWGNASAHLPYNEDVWFACGAHYLGKLSSQDQANRHCIESVPFVKGMEVPLGVHKPWAYQNIENLQRLANVCLPLQELMKIRREREATRLGEL